MSVLFAHDHRFIRHDGRIYSEFQFARSLWARYREMLGDISVVAREAPMPATKGLDQLELSAAGDIPFHFVPNLSTPVGLVRQRSVAKGVIDRALANSRALVARLPSEVGLLAIERARALGIPYAVEMAGCPWDGLWNHGSWQGKAYAPIAMMRYRSALAHAPFVIFVTKEFLQRRYPARSGYAVGCSDVELPVVHPEVLEQRMRHIGSRSSDARVVLGCIGTLRTRVKGIQTVMRALALRPGLHERCEFRVLGVGDPAPWMREAEALGVLSVIRFDGTRPAGQPVLKWLDDIDVYLQPSLKEGLPRALVEAMSRGCPAIGSRCAGIPELIEDECLIRPGRADELADLIERAIDDSDWCRDRAIANFATAGEYTSDALDMRRRAFFRRFMDHVDDQSGRVT